MGIVNDVETYSQYTNRVVTKATNAMIAYFADRGVALDDPQIEHAKSAWYHATSIVLHPTPAVEYPHEGYQFTLF